MPPGGQQEGGGLEGSRARSAAARPSPGVPAARVLPCPAHERRARQRTRRRDGAVTPAAAWPIGRNLAGDIGVPNRKPTFMPPGRSSAS